MKGSARCSLVLVSTSLFQVTDNSFMSKNTAIIYSPIFLYKMSKDIKENSENPVNNYSFSLAEELFGVK